MNARAEAPSTLIPTPWPGLYVKSTHTPRNQYSASQLETADCNYLWGLRYLIGLRQPESKIETREDELVAIEKLTTATKRERSLLFGGLLHKRLERYFRGEQVDWTDDVGQRALMGLGFLPQASQLTQPLRIEAPISLKPNSVFGDVHIAFVGFVDLECDQPELDILYDYKTTGNFRWMKRPDELRENVAACLYALSSMQRKGTTQQRCRWVYFASVGKPAARAVDFMITHEQALAVVRSAFIKASGLSAQLVEYRDNLDDLEAVEGILATYITHRLPLIDHLPKNTSICESYGGCPMHYSAGGPCRPGPKTFDLDSLALDLGSVKETDHTTTSSQPKEQDMSTLAERLAILNGNPPVLPQQPAQAAPVFAAAPAANPFAPAAQAPAAPVSPAVFGAPIVAADGLTAPAPAVAPFNPNANPFGMAPTAAAAPAAPAVNPFAALQPAAPAAPVAPTFATSSLPPVGALPVFQGFGTAPTVADVPPAAAMSATMAAAAVAFPGVNSPEASTAISAAEAAAQPAGKRKRRTKAEMQADAASGVSVGAVGATTTQPDGFEVTITIRDLNTEAALTIPAPDNIAAQMVGALATLFEGLR